MWQKNFNREIPFLHSAIIILFLFITSVVIIYYTSVSSSAVVDNYSNLIIKHSNQLDQENNKIMVTSPRPHDLLGQSFILTGLAKVPEAKLNYRIINDFNEIIQQGVILTNKADVFSPFLLEVELNKDNLTPQGRIELFPENANEEDVFNLPIKFSLK